ncbi:MAG: hypothetical protein WC783_01435 [Candidatus Paceibacterota bacterium]|jgi:hypothetical protein
MKIKFFTPKKKFRKGGLTTNPDFFWDAILLLVLLLIIVSFIFGFFLFKKVNNDAFSDYEITQKKIDTVSQERMESILKYFDARRAKSLDILNSPSPFIDPSL